MKVAAGQRAELRCESRGGNPAPLIKWFIDDLELLGDFFSVKLIVFVYILSTVCLFFLGSRQTNQTELNDDGKWNAVSRIAIPFRKVSF